MRSLQLLFLFLCLISLQRTMAQGSANDVKLPKILPPSPEAAAITKNAELSVGLYNGAPQANIPLYNIKLSDYTLPISLGYASNGLKVDEIPSRTGMGWSLSAGGVITRVVQGRPDDLTTRYSLPGTLDLGLASLTAFYQLSEENSTYDAEPDEFRIAAPGLSGKFVLDNNNQPVLIPYSNLKIQVNGVSPYNEFIVTNTEGIKYYFGGTGGVEVTTNHNLSGKLSGYQQVNTGFFLKKIELLNGESINFSYSVIGIRQYTGVTHSLTKDAGIYDGNCADQTCPVGNAVFQETVSDVSYNSLLLNTITASNGVNITFQYENRPDNSNDKRLTGVNINEGSMDRKFSLTYLDPTGTGSYWGHTMGSYNKRFFLQELKSWTQKGTVMSEVLKHSFEYSGNINQLPARLSYAQDHYGFFNGANNSNLIPAGFGTIDFGSVANADREPSGAAAAGLLNKIIYPTGGYELLEYGGNKYSTAVLVPLPGNVNTGGQGANARDIVTYTSATITPVRNHTAKLAISATVAPSCISCTPPGFGVDRIVDVYFHNLTTGTYIRRILYTLTNTIEDFALVANNTYRLEIRVMGDYVDGFVQLQYDPYAQDTYTYIWKNAPGINVTHIRSHDNVTNVTTDKYYKYTYLSNQNASSGIILTSLNYEVSNFNKILCPEVAFGAYRICLSKTLTSNSNAFQYLYDNNHYVYRAVLESDHPDFNNGVTEHIFEASDFVWGYPLTGPDMLNIPNNTNSWYNGNETTTRYYDNALSLVKSVDKYYSLNANVNTQVKGLIARRYYSVTAPPDNPVSMDEIEPYEAAWYLYQSGWVQLDSIVTRDYAAGIPSLTSKIFYAYGSPANMLPVRTETTNSRNQTIKEETKYPTDYSGQTPYQRMIEKNIISPVIESKKTTAGSLVSIQKNDYYDFSASQTAGAPVIIKPQTVQVQNGTGPLEIRLRYHKYDIKGNPVELSKENDMRISYIWDYANTYPIAEVINASTDQIAYTSFESDGWGGWTMNGGSSILNYGGLTGNKTISGGVNRTVPAGNYVVSVWSGANTWINGQSQTQSPAKILGPWRYFEVVLTNVSSINVAGDNIDEVRLYPVGAQMTTYTYDPLIGMTSQCDANNRITYYEYDSFARLLRIRDENKNIIKQFDYQYQAPTHANPIWQVTGVTRCKPCPGNSAYITNILQNEEKDTNPNSATFNQTRWTDAGTNSNCVISPDWQNTATAIRCKQVSSQNTGEQEQEQRDMNPCSSSYNTTRWVVIGTNLTACPIPCNSSNCSGNDKKCINGVCETGGIITISSVWKKVYIDGVQVWKWECTHKYCFSDATTSTYSWITYHDASCTVSSCAVD